MCNKKTVELISHLSPLTTHLQKVEIVKLVIFFHYGKAHYSLDS